MTKTTTSDDEDNDMENGDGHGQNGLRVADRRLPRMETRGAHMGTSMMMTTTMTMPMTMTKTAMNDNADNDLDNRNVNDDIDNDDDLDDDDDSRRTNRNDFYECQYDGGKTHDNIGNVEIPSVIPKNNTRRIRPDIHRFQRNTFKSRLRKAHPT